jgi:hypothetical protein
VFGLRGDFKQGVVVRCHRAVPAFSKWAIASTASNSTATGRATPYAAVELAGVTGPSSIRLQQACLHRDSSKFLH